MAAFMDPFLKVLSTLSPMIVALIAIIPTVIANRKKTQESIKASQDETKKHIEKIQSTLEAHIREDEDEQARNQRYRILRFYDEICEHRIHSESHFEDILDDIDEYEKYCASHPDFKNCRGQVAMMVIKQTYAKLKSNGGFLTHDRD